MGIRICRRKPIFEGDDYVADFEDGSIVYLKSTLPKSQ